MATTASEARRGRSRRMKAEEWANAFIGILNAMTLRRAGCLPLAGPSREALHQ